jgi:hypothetical protein
MKLASNHIRKRREEINAKIDQKEAEFIMYVMNNNRSRPYTLLAS